MKTTKCKNCQGMGKVSGFTTTHYFIDNCPLCEGSGYVDNKTSQKPKIRLIYPQQVPYDNRRD